MEDLKSQGMRKLILDLQDNPGGYMDRAINIADEFLSGNKMIVYTDGKKDQYDTEARASKEGNFEDGPLVVLLDEGSASASEIVAGAIQDNDRGLIVGRRSFGKGLVQIPITLNDGSELRLTISRYYTPSGRSIQRPYEDLNSYNHDRQYRFEHGEMFTADSIKFSDSLKYKTSKGRQVFGGGGIMPDYFVPLDTSSYSDYYRKLIYRNAIREYTLKYYEKNKKNLDAMKFEDFRKKFEISDAMLRELVNIGKSVNVPYDESGFQVSKELIKHRVKSQIARNVWGNEGFYPIYNEQDEIFQKALTLFDEARELASR